jgi:hypothetical protein
MGTQVASYYVRLPADFRGRLIVPDPVMCCIFIIAFCEIKNARKKKYKQNTENLASCGKRFLDRKMVFDPNDMCVCALPFLGVGG